MNKEIKFTKEQALDLKESSMLMTMGMELFQKVLKELTPSQQQTVKEMFSGQNLK